MENKIVIAVTGASGSIYAKLLLDRLVSAEIPASNIALIFSKNAEDVWKYELEGHDFSSYPFEIMDRSDFFKGPASGSAGYRTMIICPASMGTLGRIAAGISDDLITRAADVILKERGTLILVPRETPYNLIHLRNLTALAEAGAVIVPASPSFYSKPTTIADAANTVIDKVLSIAKLDKPGFVWGQ